MMTFPKAFQRIFFLTGICLSGFATLVSAQINERVYSTNYRIDPEQKGDLSAEFDNISFFKNNEYAGKMMDGYTLPGFWLQAKAIYNPLENIKLEAGVHLLRYWGANKYPNFAYQDITYWKGDQFQRGFRALPWFRAQIALSKNVDIILGNIYGGANHRLIEPLYHPELNLTADPETGLQLLYTSKYIDLDAWVNWESFIFRDDVHQEAFTFGLSTRVKFNDPASRFHFYLPVQALAQHRGGEIDTLLHNSVQTLMNASIGIGMTWNTGHPLVTKVDFEIDQAGYYQQQGELWPFDSGHGFYARASADIYDFRVKTSYWRCDDFISMFGSPFYGAVSTQIEGALFKQPQMVYLGLEYSRSFGKGYAMGINFDVYNHFATDMYLPEEGCVRVKSALSYDFGIYFRINPSFLIKKF
ncbi:MAG: hypothetical protein LUD02_07860 [Tannerellaceae bacterium]|nr:hypothetical protein [Tannerellaceae bacterium]